MTTIPLGERSRIRFQTGSGSCGVCPPCEHCVPVCLHPCDEPVTDGYPPARIFGVEYRPERTDAADDLGLDQRDVLRRLPAEIRRLERPPGCADHSVYRVYERRREDSLVALPDPSEDINEFDAAVEDQRDAKTIGRDGPRVLLVVFGEPEVEQFDRAARDRLERSEVGSGVVDADRPCERSQFEPKVTVDTRPPRTEPFAVLPPHDPLDKGHGHGDGHERCHDVRDPRVELVGVRHAPCHEDGRRDDEERDGGRDCAWREVTPESRREPSLRWECGCSATHGRVSIRCGGSASLVPGASAETGYGSPAPGGRGGTSTADPGGLHQEVGYA